LSNVSTTGLSTGTYTYYAVATDASSVTSAASSATLTITPATAPLVLAGPTNYLKLDADGVTLDVWNNGTGSGTPDTQIALSLITTISFAGTFASDALTVDFSAGNPLAAITPGLSYSGGGGASDALNVIGTAGNDTVNVGVSSIDLSATFGSTTISYSGATAINFTGVDGTDVLTQTAQPGNNASLAFADSSSNDTVDVQVGTYTFGGSSSGIRQIVLGTLNVSAGANAAYHWRRIMRIAIC